MSCRPVSAVLLASVLLSLLVSLPVSAQDEAAGETARWHDVAARLEPAAFISVALKDGTRVKGTLMSVSEATFTLKPRTRIPVAAKEIAFAEVAAIERTKQGMNPGQKVLIGTASVVGGTLLVVGALLAGSY